MSLFHHASPLIPRKRAAWPQPPVASAADCLRLGLGLLGAACLVTAACLGQSPAELTHAPSGPPDARTIVQHASYNELHAGNGPHPFAYTVHSTDGSKRTTKRIMETRDGDMTRLLEQDGHPLDADKNAAELARLNKLRDNPDDQLRRHKKAQADSMREDEMVRLLPEAFLYTYKGMVPGPNGPCYRLAFAPNPDFHPPDRQAEVYHGMAGELWIDSAQQRMARLDAHMIADVNFGWGVVGRLFKGGTILVEQKDVGQGHWETTHQRLHLTGKILLVKDLDIDSTDDSSDFAPVPDAGYQAAIAMLEKTPIPAQP